MPYRSFTKQKDWFLRRPDLDPDYAGMLKDGTQWFVELAGDSKHDGLRDLIVHHMFRTQLFYQPGKAPYQNQVHAFLYGPVSSTRSVLPSIQGLVDSLFGFLDLYVMHFSLRMEQQIEAQRIVPGFSSTR